MWNGVDLGMVAVTLSPRWNVRLDNIQWFKKLTDPLMNISCFKRIPKSYGKRTLSGLNLADEEPSENKITSR